MAESLHDKIERERKAASPNADDLVLFRRYAEGEQDQTLTADQKAVLGSAANAPYADNVVDMVISAWSARLRLTGFTVENEGVQRFLDDLFVRNHLGGMSYDVNYAAGRDGNTAVLLRWLPEDRAVRPQADPGAESGEFSALRGRGRVTVHAEDWWDGKTGVWVAYDDRGRPSYAVKDFMVWIDQPDGPPREFKRRTVYFPDRIERYIEDGRGWAVYSLPSDPEGSKGRVPWLKRNGEPLGLPVIHFPFRRFGRRPYGRSELAGGLIANQNHVNDIQQDLAAAAKLLGFQILTGTGVEFTTAPKLEPGTILHTKKADARFGAIPAGDVGQLNSALETKLQTVGRISSTPIHIIKGGDWPAGIALVQADKPIIIKVFSLAEPFGEGHQAVGHRATEMANAFGGEAMDENALIQARFADPEQLDQLSMAEVEAAKAQAQVAIELLQDEESLIAMGMTPEEARARLQRREQRAQAEAERLTGIAAAGSDNDEGEGKAA